MRRIVLDRDLVVSLYLGGESVIDIARQMGCSDGPIYGVLRERGVPAGRRAAIDADELRRLYLDEQMSPSAIAERFAVCDSTIRAHLRRAGVPMRTHLQSLQPLGRATCPASVEYRAFALGFVWGDLAAERLSPQVGATIAVRGSTTKADQIAVIESLFGPFGYVTARRYGRAYGVRVSLDPSYEFLLSKYSHAVPTWVSGAFSQAAFAAGYIDAEGCFGIYDGRARFKLDSYDGEVHEWLDGWLTQIGVQHATRHIVTRREPTHDVWVWRTTVNEALSLCRLIATIGPFTRHARRRTTMKAVSDNVAFRLQSRDPTILS